MKWEDKFKRLKASYDDQIDRYIISLGALEQIQDMGGPASVLARKALDEIAKIVDDGTI